MLIGLLGTPGAGRAAVARTLSAWGWRSMAFSDAVRIEVAAAWGIDERLLMSRKHQDVTTPQLAVGGASNARWLEWAAVRGHSLVQPRSPAWVLQQWVQFRRGMDPQWWVKPVAYWVRLEQQQAERRGAEAMLVVTDCEPGLTALAVRSLGGYLVRVHRPALAGAGPAAQAALPAAAATIDVDAADDDIVNDAALPELAAEVVRVVRGLQARERMAGLRDARGAAGGAA